MIENLPGEFNNTSQLGELLDPLPELGDWLDFALRRLPARLGQSHNENIGSGEWGAGSGDRK